MFPYTTSDYNPYGMPQMGPPPMYQHPFQHPEPIVVPPAQPWGQGAMSGAMQGATVGSAFGPWGTGLGGLLGYAGGTKK